MIFADSDGGSLEGLPIEDYRQGSPLRITLPPVPEALTSAEQADRTFLTNFIAWDTVGEAAYQGIRKDAGGEVWHATQVIRVNSDRTGERPENYYVHIGKDEVIVGRSGDKGTLMLRDGEVFLRENPEIQPRPLRFVRDKEFLLSLQAFLKHDVLQPVYDSFRDPMSDEQVASISRTNGHVAIADHYFPPQAVEPMLNPPVPRT